MALSKRVKTWQGKLTPGKQYPAEEAFKLVKDLAKAKFDETIQSWDATFKDTKASDYVVGQVWARKGADKFAELVKLYGRQPRLSVRTSTSMRDQAYSTPVPLAYVASRLARVEPVEGFHLHAGEEVRHRIRRSDHRQWFPRTHFGHRQQALVGVQVLRAGAVEEPCRLVAARADRRLDRPQDGQRVALGTVEEVVLGHGLGAWQRRVA